MASQFNTLSPREAQAHLVHLGGSARETYRWLRLGLLVAVAAVVASGAIEWSKSRCLEGSLSEYYWTPARPVLVGGLMALSLGLIALRGSTDAEDTALNLAGLFAPVVAVVPVRPTSGCSSAPESLPTMAASVENNIRALLVVAAIAVVGVAVMLLRRHTHRAPAWIGWALAAAAVAGLGVWAMVSPATMEPGAHYLAAVGVFGSLVVVVVLNARHTPGSRLTKLYHSLAVAMVVALLLEALDRALHLADWSLLATETVLVIAFCVFWIVQTVELWDAGVRPGLREAQGRSSA